MKILVEFRPDLYGKAPKLWVPWYRGWRLHFLFYRKDEKGNLDYITSRAIPWLQAVTSDQYNTWSNYDLVVKLGWVKR